MYERFFGFRERPFDLTPNPRFLVLTEGHREALTAIVYAIATRKGICLLIGEAGSGKTTVIRAAIEQQPAHVHCVHIHNPALTRPEFIEILGARFDLSERARHSKGALLLELEDLLRRRQAANETTVLIVDEAQSIPFDLLEEIRLLANIETNEEKLLSVILAGQPALAIRLDDPSMSQMKQRIALWCELHPLTFNETAEYVLSRIKSAGGIACNVFSLEAVALIHEEAKGVPRIINVIADNALVHALAELQRPVTRQIVQEVCHGLRIQPGGRAPEPITAGDTPSAATETSSAQRPTENGAETLFLQLHSRPEIDLQPEPSVFARISRRYFSWNRTF